MRSQAEKGRLFRELHARPGILILPNPWDAGTARLLASLGFEALATTSLGMANALGRVDGEGAVSRAELLENCRIIAEATDLPVNADFESGYATTAEGVAESVRMAIATGVAALSIEDSTGDAEQPLRAVADAVERMRAARAAIDGSGGDTLLVGRAENFIVGRPDLADTIARLKAYADAGADCLYAPGIHTREQIDAVVAAVKPKPVNLLLGAATDWTLADVAAMGVRRISVGGGLARAAWAGFLRAARGLAQGRFDGLAGATPGAVRGRAPLLGEHSDAILAELGYTEAQIAQLRAANVV
jgi:2-methylisocitrate lyase-like PEP mutase family enzyme